jgi:uncharacterized damage-inducible protein DinB
MITSIHEFINSWQHESAATLKMFSALTDESLKHDVYAGGRTLGRLANHILETLTELPSKLQLGIQEEHPHFDHTADLVANYERCSKQLVDTLQSNWTDADLQKTNPMYGEEWTNAFSLQVLLMHQCHHRGQMTVLMRQAGLKVPGIYGPSKEEWVSYGMTPQD